MLLVKFASDDIDIEEIRKNVSRVLENANESDKKYDMELEQIEADHAAKAKAIQDKFERGMRGSNEVYKKGVAEAHRNYENKIRDIRSRYWRPKFPIKDYVIPGVVALGGTALLVGYHNRRKRKDNG